MEKQDLIDELTDAIDDRMDMDVSYSMLAEACVERMEQIGVVDFGPSKGAIHDKIAEQVSLAKTYAEDGAMRTAARIFGELSKFLNDHMDACDAEMQAWTNKEKQ